MNLTALSGNERVKEQLSRLEKERGLSHAYIISGPAGSGKHILARLLAAGMLCASTGEKPCGHCTSCLKIQKGLHPDVSVVTGPEAGKPITVDQVRALRADAYIRPNEGERKVYLLEGADQMNASAQSVLLKLLEEGPRFAAFLLLARNAGALLETVRSRCETFDLHLGGWTDDTGADQEQTVLVCRMADALEQADELELLETSMEFAAKRSREEYILLLNALEEELCARTARSGDRRRLLRAVELVKSLRGAARLNVSAGQLSGWLCAGMWSSPDGCSFFSREKGTEKELYCRSVR